MLKHGADATTRDDFGQSVLFIYLATLIESESGEPDPGVVQLLLEHGVDVTVESDVGLLGIIHVAMWAGANSEVIRLLLEHGADTTLREDGAIVCCTWLRGLAQALKSSSCYWRTGRM